MRIINGLTPEIKGKAFDVDWFLLRQRFEEIERVAASKLPSSPAGEMGTVCADVWDGQRCTRKVGHAGMHLSNGKQWASDEELAADAALDAIPDPLGADISGPKGSGGATGRSRSKQVPEKTISEECRWCADGLPEWSAFDNCWIHRRVAVDKRCLRKTLSPTADESAAPIAPAAQDEHLLYLGMKAEVDALREYLGEPTCYPGTEWGRTLVDEVKARLARAERKEGEAKHG